MTHKAIEATFASSGPGLSLAWLCWCADIDRAEELAQDALVVTAVAEWPRIGVPQSRRLADAVAKRRHRARCITHSAKLSIAAMAICVEISKAKRQLSKLMDASVRGEEVILQEAGVALARLVPVAKAAAGKPPSGQ